MKRRQLFVQGGWVAHGQGCERSCSEYMEGKSGSKSQKRNGQVRIERTTFGKCAIDL